MNITIDPADETLLNALEAHHAKAITVAQEVLLQGSSLPDEKREFICKLIKTAFLMGAVEEREIDPMP